MKLEAIAKRISLARESKIKHVMPYENFFDKLELAADLQDFVENEKTDRKIKHEARKYVVITCASCMETYFKRVAQVFINAGWIKNDFREILRHEKISLDDLLEINKKELSLGEIISVSHSMQDLESINKFYSKMLGIKDFIKTIEKVKVEPEEGEKYTLKSKFPDFREKIGELLDLRHLIIHHEGFKGILGNDRLTRMGLSVIAFVSAADTYLMEKIPKD
jgi:hypothetical protein